MMRIITFTTLLFVGMLSLSPARGQAIRPVPDSFLPKVNLPVNAVARQADGKILIGGGFTTVGGASKQYLARLNVDGSLDTAFSARPNAPINRIVIQPDGKILIAGTFSAVSSVVRNWIARLHDDGTLDTSFSAVLDGPCFAMAVQTSDNKILAGGSGYLARFETDGSLDTTFNRHVTAGDAGAVYDIVVQPDLNILVGGSFTSFDAVSQSNIVRLTPTGQPDLAGFASDVGGSVRTIALQPNGQVLIGGEFDTIEGAPASKLARLNSNGTADSSFQPNINGSIINDIILLPSGQLLAAGTANFSKLAFTTFNLARIESNGDIDTTFNPRPLGDIQEMVIQPDGRLIVVGYFNNINLVARPYIARLVDTTPATSASFTSASATVSEADGTHVVTVTMPSSITASYTLPFTVSGTASSGKDYTKLVSPLSFAPGEVSKDITINLLNDGLVEPDETLILTLGTPSDPAVAKLAPFAYTLTITSDDTPPVVTLDPLSQIVAVGDPVTFSSAATGTPAPTLQWTKNRASIRGSNAADHNIPAAKLTDAGSYAMKAIGANVTDTSASATLTVVDQTGSNVAAPTLGTVSFTIKASSPEVESFQWFHGATALVNGPLILGATTSRLTLKGLTTGDAGNYHCEVTASPGTLAGGTHTLIVYDSVPDLIVAAPPLVLDTTMVSEDYSFIQPIDPDPLKTPTKFVITGLPRGLTYNKVTGEIYGRALIAGTYDKIKITPSNLKGKGTVIDAVLEVLPLPPGSDGAYVAMIDKDPVVTAGLGGRLTMSVSAAGAVSGRLIAGAESLAFRGVLDTLAAGGDPTATITVKRSRGLPAFLLNLVLHPGSHLMDGTLTITGGLDSAPINGWSNIWSTRGMPVVDFLGYHTLIIDLALGDEGIEAIPQGCGYGSISVTSAGATSFVGKTGDGNTILFRSLLGPTGQVLVQQMLYRNTGSIQGILGIAADAGHTLGNTLDWHKNAQANLRERNYKAGFASITVTAKGGLYTPPARTDPAMGLVAGPDNAELNFLEGGISTAPQSPDIVFEIRTSATGVMPTFASGNNPDKVTFSVSRTTGLFSGRFTLVNTISLSPLKKITRTVTYRGIIFPNGVIQQGGGNFPMAKLPANPADPANTTDILAGAVTLSAH